MGAGVSAGYEAQRSLLDADAYERMAAECRAKAGRYALAARTERSVGGRLTALEHLGWRVLADRRWAGSKRANVDFLVVGPGGVAVVDVKAWRALAVRGDSIFCDDDCRDEEAGKLLSLTQRVEEMLGSVGLCALAIRPVLVFAGRAVEAEACGVSLVGENNLAAWLTRRGQRLTSEQVDQITDVLDQGFPPYDVQEPRSRVLPTRRVAPLPSAVDPEQEALLEVDELVEALIEDARRGPIEEWMTFLHPEQLRLVSASWGGPARVRGPAGTGKTVVGLHRAVRLAERSPDPILFVTFVRTLPVVLGSLATRLSPAAAGRVEFSGLHAFARRVLDGLGIDVHVDSARITTAFNRAWLQHGRGSVLASLDERPSYWKEEIDYVVKGRGLTDFDEYAELARLGRQTPMRREHREALWRLYTAYQLLLEDAGTHDFNDLLILARDAVRSGRVEASYGGVIVDEVQDLTLVGIELLHAVAGEGPDRLLVIGDGQQAVYPGGFTLAEAGIAVTGRAAILRTNYRNTAEILQAATAMIQGDPFDDLEGVAESGDRPVEVRRHGSPPFVTSHPSPAACDRWVVATVNRLLGEGVRLGDIAVLSARRADVGRCARVLRSAGVEVIELTEYEGVTTEAVKVGTFKRAKGLEFAQVLLPGLRADAPEAWDGESSEAFRERVERERRELFVGMTRARDGLWLGYIAAAT